MYSKGTIATLRIKSSDAKTITLINSRSWEIIDCMRTKNQMTIDDIQLTVKSFNKYVRESQMRIGRIVRCELYKEGEYRAAECINNTWAAEDTKPDEVERSISRAWSKGQAIKSIGWMPRHQKPKKDATSCEKLRRDANSHWTVDVRMGEPTWG